MRSTLLYSLATIALLIVLPDKAQAYIGPGAGLTAIGTVLAFIAAILLAVVGFVWYPLKRLFTAIKNKNKTDQGDLPS